VTFEKSWKMLVAKAVKSLRRELRVWRKVGAGRKVRFEKVWKVLVAKAGKIFF
jgi:hypothetical protein